MTADGNVQKPPAALAAAAGLIAGGFYTYAVAAVPPAWTALLLVAVPGFLAVLAAGRAREILLTIAITDTLFRLDIHLFYRSEIGDLYGLGGLNISATTLCLAALYALWTADLLLGRDRLPPYLLRASLPPAAYVLIVLLSVGTARDVGLSLFGAALLLQTFLLYVYIVGTVRTPGEIRLLVTVLAVGVLLESLLGIGVRLTGKAIGIAGLKVQVDQGRMAGTLGSANETAAALVLFMGPAAGLALARTGGRLTKSIATLALCLGSVALILTFSRGGWVNFVVCGSILCALAWRRRWLPRSFLPGVAAVALVLILVFHQQIEARLFGDDRGSAESRIPLMELAFDLIQDHPWLGVGVNNYADRMIRHAMEDGWTWVTVVHNKYLLVCAETGIVGLITFGWFLVATLSRGWTCWKFGDPLLSPVALGITGAVAGQTVHMLVDIFASPQLVQGLWLSAALLAAARWMRPGTEQHRVDAQPTREAM